MNETDNQPAVSQRSDRPEDIDSGDESAQNVDTILFMLVSTIPELFRVRGLGSFTFSGKSMATLAFKLRTTRVSADLESLGLQQEFVQLALDAVDQYTKQVANPKHVSNYQQGVHAVLEGVIDEYILKCQLIAGDVSAESRFGFSHHRVQQLFESGVWRLDEITLLVGDGCLPSPDDIDGEREPLRHMESRFETFENAVHAARFRLYLIREYLHRRAQSGSPSAVPRVKIHFRVTGSIICGNPITFPDHPHPLQIIVEPGEGQLQAASFSMALFGDQWDVTLRNLYITQRVLLLGRECNWKLENCDCYGMQSNCICCIAQARCYEFHEAAACRKSKLTVSHCRIHNTNRTYPGILFEAEDGELVVDFCDISNAEHGIAVSERGNSARIKQTRIWDCETGLSVHDVCSVRAYDCTIWNTNNACNIQGTSELRKVKIYQLPQVPKNVGRRDLGPQAPAAEDPDATIESMRRMFQACKADGASFFEFAQRARFGINTSAVAAKFRQDAVRKAYVDAMAAFHGSILSGASSSMQRPAASAPASISDPSTSNASSIQASGEAPATDPRPAAAAAASKKTKSKAKKKNSEVHVAQSAAQLPTASNKYLSMHTSSRSMAMGADSFEAAAGPESPPQPLEGGASCTTLGMHVASASAPLSPEETGPDSPEALQTMPGAGHSHVHVEAAPTVEGGHASSLPVLAAHRLLQASSSTSVEAGAGCGIYIRTPQPVPAAQLRALPASAPAGTGHEALQLQTIATPSASHTQPQLALAPAPSFDPTQTGPAAGPAEIPRASAPAAAGTGQPAAAAVARRPPPYKPPLAPKPPIADGAGASDREALQRALVEVQRLAAEREALGRALEAERAQQARWREALARERAGAAAAASEAAERLAAAEAAAEAAAAAAAAAASEAEEERARGEAAAEEARGRLRAALRRQREALAAAERAAEGGVYVATAAAAVAGAEGEPEAALGPLTEGGLRGLRPERLAALAGRLQEAAALALRLAAEAEAERCAVCMDRPRGVALRPCGHARLCEPCAALVRECPDCRARIADRVPIVL